MANLPATLPFKLGGPVSDAAAVEPVILATHEAGVRLADIEKNFTAIVKVVGGRAYVDGVAVDYPGAIAATHFRSNTMIPNEQKMQPYSTVQLGTTLGLNCTVSDDPRRDRRDASAYIPMVSVLGKGWAPESISLCAAHITGTPTLSVEVDMKNGSLIQGTTGDVRVIAPGDWDANHRVTLPLKGGTLPEFTPGEDDWIRLHASVATRSDFNIFNLRLEVTAKVLHVS
jgi:hypothetical protein